MAPKREDARRTPTQRPPNVLQLRAGWSLLDGIWGVLPGSWGCAGYLPSLRAVFCTLAEKHPVLGPFSPGRRRRGSGTLKGQQPQKLPTGRALSRRIAGVIAS